MAITFKCARCGKTEDREFFWFSRVDGKKVCKKCKDYEQPKSLMENIKELQRQLLLEIKEHQEFCKVADEKNKSLEQELAEKEKEIKKIYPFVKKYHNGIFVEYNVVSERDGIISTTVFGKNKELAYKYKNSIKGESK